MRLSLVTALLTISFFIVNALGLKKKKEIKNMFPSSILLQELYISQVLAVKISQEHPK